MSDFVTRLVERQAGTVAIVQPRTPSMFAPTMSRTGTGDSRVIDSLSAFDHASRTPPASIRPVHHRSEVQTQVEQEDDRGPVTGSRSTPRAAVEPRRAESSPTPLVRNASAVVHQPVHESLAATPVRSLSIHEQAPSRQRGLAEQHVDAGIVLRERRIEPPPPLVKSRHDAPRSSATAPPSLVSGAVTGRRAESNHVASTEPRVEVTIGRIEVTAVSTVPDTKQKPGSRRPAMSLEDYLTRRQGGKP